MSKISIRSVMLGIGIGIIITATAGIIYIAGRDPMKELTEQQIITQAEKYGMVRSQILQSKTKDEETPEIFKARLVDE